MIFKNIYILGIGTMNLIKKTKDNETTDQLVHILIHYKNRNAVILINRKQVKIQPKDSLLREKLLEPHF